LRVKVDDLRQRQAQVEKARQPVSTPVHSNGSTKPEKTETHTTILAVDDSPTIGKLVELALSRHGYNVVLATDGMEALGKLGEVNPDMVLLDINMPRMDGYQVCKAIRGNATTRHIPVIMLSGKDGFFDKVRGRLAGSTDYITKPFEPEKLLIAVQKYR
jgi:twitching motility two-component system response regulator PilG